MQRFESEGTTIIDHDTGERLATMEDCLTRLNELNVLVDMEVEGGEDYAGFDEAYS